MGVVLEDQFDLVAHCAQVRRSVLELAHNAGKGHIGSALSIVEIVSSVLMASRGFGSEEPGRDRVVLSKGHAAMALYANLAILEVIDREALLEYCADGSALATHPIVTIPGVDFSTGSLGQGITFAVGSGLASKIRGDGSHVTCIMSDSELNEGSTWEAALIAAQLMIGSLTVVLDLNGQQALGFTRDVLNTRSAPHAWQEFGWDLFHVDGHDVPSLREALANARKTDRPSLIVARTTAGKGVSFMEGRVEWHYLPMTDEQFAIALDEVSETRPNAL